MGDNSSAGRGATWPITCSRMIEAIDPDPVVAATTGTGNTSAAIGALQRV
jgi:hypothetical protein